MHAATYHRVSTLDQNPALARDELRAAAGRLGAEVVLDVDGRQDAVSLPRSVIRTVRAGVSNGSLNRRGELHLNFFDDTTVRAVDAVMYLKKLVRPWSRRGDRAIGVTCRGTS